MNRVILLRFHKSSEIVQNRIDLLKYFNPGMPIYGLFGGAKSDFPAFAEQLTDLNGITYLDIEDGQTKWRFSDYTILKWYLDFGKTIDFDILHTIEYDLVILDRLENVYQYNPGEQHVYITNLQELDKIIPESNWFQNPQFPTKECFEFVELMKSKYKLEKLFNSKAPGATLTKEYLEGYAKLDLPMTGFDEIRLPAIAQILGIELRDTNFVLDWFDEDSIDFRLFNTDNAVVPKAEILKAYKTNYRKAFHPVFDLISQEDLHD